MFYCIIIDSISPHLVHETLKMTRSIGQNTFIVQKKVSNSNIWATVYTGSRNFDQIYWNQCLPDWYTL